MAPVDLYASHLQVKVIGRPDIPEGPLEFDDIQARSLRVSWRPPSDDGGSDILGYIVERREVPKAAWCTVDARVTESSLVVKGLKENVEYHFKVSAENQFGVSRSLKSDNAVMPKTPLCEYACSFTSSRVFLFTCCLAKRMFDAVTDLQAHQNHLATPLRSWM